MANHPMAAVSQRGASLITTLLLLLTLSVLGIAALTASRTSAMILTPIGTAWDGLLANPAPALQAVAVPGMTGVYYQYQFLDDDDGDSNPDSDSNGMILIRATGYVDSAAPAGLSSNDAQVALEAGYFRPSAAANYAQENMDAGNTNATVTAQNVDTSASGKF